MTMSAIEERVWVRRNCCSRAFRSMRCLASALDLAVDEHGADKDLFDSGDPWPPGRPAPDLPLNGACLNAVGLIWLLQRRLFAIVLLENDHGEVCVLRMGNCFDRG